MNLWESSKLKKKENMAKAQDRALDADLMVQSFDVTICIYVVTALEKQPRNSVLKNMNRSIRNGHFN
jgi:hypothetical protein